MGIQQRQRANPRRFTPSILEVGQRAVRLCRDMTQEAAAQVLEMSVPTMRRYLVVAEGAGPMLRRLILARSPRWSRIGAAYAVATLPLDQQEAAILGPKDTRSPGGRLARARVAASDVEAALETGDSAAIEFEVRKLLEILA